MSDLDRKLRDYHRRLGDPASRRRERLMASLPTEPPAWAQSSRWRERLTRRSTLGALLAVLLASAAIWWLTAMPEPAVASEVFAQVLHQIRSATTVTYTCTTHVEGYPPKTSRLMFLAPGRERKETCDDLQVSDYVKGRFLIIDMPGRWYLQLDSTPKADTPIQRGQLEKLKRLAEDSGKFVKAERLDGKWVHRFEAAGAGRAMTIWAHPATDLPVKVRIVSKPKPKDAGSASRVTVTLSNFAWNVKLDESLFDQTPPEGHRRYHIRLIDRSQPPEEKDLLEMLRILADLGDGAFPPSLLAKDLQPLVKKMDLPAVSMVNLGIGATVVIGTRTDDRDEPAMVRYFRGYNAQLQMSQGTAFVNRLSRRRRPWRYVGKGARWGQKGRQVFWYRPLGAKNFRVIHADLSVRIAPPRKRSTASGNATDDRSKKP